MLAATFVARAVVDYITETHEQVESRRRGRLTTPRRLRSVASVPAASGRYDAARLRVASASV